MHNEIVYERLYWNDREIPKSIHVIEFQSSPIGLIVPHFKSFPSAQKCESFIELHLTSLCKQMSYLLLQL